MNDELRKKLTGQQGQVVEIKTSILKQLNGKYRNALDNNNQAEIDYYEAFRHGVICMTETILDAIGKEKFKKGSEKNDNK